MNVMQKTKKQRTANRRNALKSTGLTSLERLQNRKPNRRNILTAPDNLLNLTAGTDGKNRTKYAKRTHFFKA